MLLLFIALLLIPVSTWGEELTAASPNYPSDFLPPQITVLSPLQDSIVETDSPLIEISFADLGSDIDLSTIRLFLDRIDVTAPATVERLDSAEHSTGGSYKIRYQPTASLKLGIHEIYFSVRDMAGNLREIHWNFQIKLAPEWGIKVSGSDTIQYNLVPTNNVTDMLDLTIQGQSRDSDIQLHLFGRILDHPDDWANFNYDNYSFFLDNYSLAVSHHRFLLTLGYTGISLESELLQNSLDKGWVASDTTSTPTGEFSWVLFSGETTTSSGINLDVNNIQGMISKWMGIDGWNFGGYCLRLGGDGNADFFDIKGNSPYGKPLTLRYEFIHGDAGGNDYKETGNGLVIHLDKPIATSVIGFDYMMFEAGFPAFNLVPVSPQDGGAQRYAIRGFTPFANGQSINFDFSIAENNLDHSVSETARHENLSLGYNLNPNPNFGLNSNYSLDFQYLSGTITNYFSVNLRKTFELSTAQTFFSLSKTKTPDPGSTFDQYSLNGSWIRTIGFFNLTPSLSWVNTNYLNGDYSATIEARLALDRQLHPEVGRSVISLYRQLGEKIPYNPAANESQYKYTTGLYAAIYLKTWGNSNLTLSSDFSKWIRENPASDGWNQSFGLTWKYFF